MEVIDTVAKEQRPPKPVCLNCEETMPRSAKFCPHCGQRNNKGKVTMREFLLRFWNNISHLDSKFIKVFWELLIPGRVTIEYFKGRQKRYPHPIQFFFVIIFFLLLAVNTLMHSDKNDYYRLYYEESKGKILATDRIKLYRDSIAPELRQHIAPDALDSLLSKANNMDKYDEKDTTNYNFIDHLVEFRIGTRDMIMLEPDSLARKYYPNDRIKSHLLRQTMKTSRVGRDVIFFYLKSLGWTVLFMIATLSTLLYFLNRKRGHYYIEAFVLLMHLASGFMLILTVGTILDIYAGTTLYWEWIPFLWFIVAILMAIKRYYQRSWLNAFGQWVLFMLIGIITFVATFILSILVVLLVF
ncbi:MAG: DUF3667 domain-containing protein [Saprospiraceae bacterium]|nr:DUF3667 domain-containing protein [Saprospiraceae bacterium]